MTKESSLVNFNTVLLAIVLGVVSWVGYTVQQTAVTMAVIVSTNANHDRELLELRSRVAAVEIALVRLQRLP